MYALLKWSPLWPCIYTILLFLIFRPHGLARAMFQVKRVLLAFTEYVRQINIYIYMKNPLFDSLVWGSFRLAPIKISTRSFKIFGIWPQTDRHTYIHTHARAQCSHASVGLAQARPNKSRENPYQHYKSHENLYTDIQYKSHMLHLNVPWNQSFVW